MAIYHLSAAIVSGNRGASAVAAAAYQSGQKLYSDLDGLVKDYDRKERVVFEQIFLPQFAPSRLKDRETLWNEIERVSGAKGQFARRFVIALPRELSLSQNIETVKKMVKKLTRRGMVCDVAVHYDEHDNPHAHIMCTMRPLLLNGQFGQMEQSEVVKVLDPNSGKMKAVCIGRDRNGRKRYKRERHKTTDWDKVETLKAIRKEWEDVENEALARAGFNERVDCRSYAERGIDKYPTKHLGPKISAMEARGIKTEVGDYNRLAQEYNAGKLCLTPEEKKKLETTAAEIDEITKQIADINAQRIKVNSLKSLLESQQNKKKEKEQELQKNREDLHGDYYNENDEEVFGRLHYRNRPTGLLAVLSGKQKSFDLERKTALKKERKLEDEIKSLENKIEDTEKDLRFEKTMLGWSNPEIEIQNSKQKQRKRPTPKRTKEQQSSR